MLRTLALVAAFALAAGAADAQKIDRNGRCHDAKGRFAKMEVCKGAGAATGASTSNKAAPSNSAATTSTASSTYKLDAKGKCRDAKGRMAKKTLCAA